MSRHLMAKMRRRAQYDDLPPLPDDFHVPDSPEGQPDRSPGWLHRQFVAPHKSVWDIPEHELDDRWNKVYDTLGFDDKTRQEWEAGRHTGKPSDKWDGGLDGPLGGGVKDYLTRAPMSKDEYARHREHSQNRAKEFADGIWDAMYPPEEEEGRKAIQNSETVNNLMNQGWQPEHIKYDEDDRPYALYQHPSGWTVSDYGGAYKEIGHAATPGEAHDAINVSRHDQDSRESYNAPFGPADAHSFIEKQLSDDPANNNPVHYHTKTDPRIRRYKPRQAGVIALAMSAVRYADGVIRGGPMRRTAGWADWRETDPDAPCPICPYERPHRDRILHVAPLENGHELHAWSFDGKRWPEMGSKLGPKELGWSWAIVDPSKYPAEPSKYEEHQDPEHHLVGNGGDSGDQDDPGHRDYIPTLDDAKAEAEAHYQRMFPVGGAGTGRHDSGVDYSDLNKFMGEL